MTPSRKGFPASLALAAVLAILGHGAEGAPESDLNQVTVAGPAGARLRIEALAPPVVRLWLKPSGVFARQRSLAMQTAPDTRVSLDRVDAAGDVGVETGALTVKVRRATLGFDVSVPRGGPPLLTGARIGAPSAGGPWSFTERLAPSERLFGLGQDNHNGGRLDRRGVIR